MVVEANTKHAPAVGVVDLTAYVAMLAASALFFTSGGAAGLGGAALGAAYGLWHSRADAPSLRLERIWQASIACLWAGMMLGGLVWGGSH